MGANAEYVFVGSYTGDKGGDVVSLVAHLEGVSQGEAARRLARMLGLEIGGRRHG